MIVKPAEFVEKMELVRKRVSDDVYGCDQCKKPIAREDGYLGFTVHRNNGDSERHEMCSWACTVKYLRKVKTDYFVSMPFLHYDIQKKGMRAKDFLALLK